MPYTAKSAPDWVKELPAEAREAWIKAYNAAYSQYDGDEGKAAATASSTIKKMGYKKGEDGKWHKTKEAAVEYALGKLSVFGADAKPVVTAVDEAAATVTVNDRTYRVPYTEKDGAYAFGTATEQVSETFSMAKEAEFIELTFAEDQQRADPEKGEWVVVIIEEGENQAKHRAYTGRALESADAKRYEGVPMHLNHVGKEGENQQVRPVQDMVSVVKKAWHAVSESGKQQIQGLVHVFDGWLRERLHDADFRKMVGLSHVADIAGHVRRAGKVATQVVESIVQPYAVDWVSKAAFGGRVTESDEISQRSEDLMALETLTVTDLETQRPDLVENISTRATQQFKAKALEDEAVTEADKARQAAEDRARTAEAKLRDVTIRQLATEEVAKSDHKIPEAVRPQVIDRVASRLSGQSVEDDKLSATVTETVKAEAAFGAGFAAPPKVKIEGGDRAADSDPSPREKLQSMADRLLGVGSTKKKEPEQ